MSSTNTDTLLIVDTYRAKTPPWTFTLRSWSSPMDGIVYTWAYRSPRMQVDGLMNDGFTEEQLIQSEVEFYVRQRHVYAIQVTLSQISQALIKDLAKLYRLQDSGKVGIEIPREIVLKEVVFPLNLTDMLGRPDSFPVDSP